MIIHDSTEIIDRRHRNKGKSVSQNATTEHDMNDLPDHWPYRTLQASLVRVRRQWTATSTPRNSGGEFRWCWDISSQSHAECSGIYTASHLHLTESHTRVSARNTATDSYWFKQQTKVSSESIHDLLQMQLRNVFWWQRIREYYPRSTKKFRNSDQICTLDNTIKNHSQLVEIFCTQAHYPKITSPTEVVVMT